jgi:hypothetical protein
MSERSVFLGRLIGLYCIVVSVAMVTHPATTIETVSRLMHDPPLLFLVGVIGLAVGLAIIVGHNLWSGGVLPVTVTLIGWLAFIKGALMLFLTPAGAQSFFLEGLRYERLYYVYAAITSIIGVVLTYAATRRARQPH